jgi:hypothetical protein
MGFLLGFFDFAQPVFFWVLLGGFFWAGFFVPTLL